MIRRLPPPVLAATVVFAAGLVAGCAKPPMAGSQDFDTYQVVAIGPIEYVTPRGIRVVEEGPGYAVHEIASLPGTRVRVDLKVDPPRSLRIDSDAEMRRFLRELPAASWSSVLYDQISDRELVRVAAKGRTETGEPLFASLSVVREEGQTAVIRIVGPRDQSAQILDLAEDLGRRLEFGASS